ncbi:MAG: ribonucleoside-diphosphate reductase subunit alpha [Chlamydiales bacterium]|nr:ribonucleoside-diphosphate reductase subunit alpha [Chlamydiales bacterium]
MTLLTEAICVKIRKRNGSIVDFDEKRVFLAISAAFCTKEWGLPKDHVLTTSQRDTVDCVFNEVLEKIAEGIRKGFPIDVEWIQDVVELVLMRQGYYAVAKDYILYRQNRAKARDLRHEGDLEIINVKSQDGQLVPFYRSQLKSLLEDVSTDLLLIDLDFLMNEIAGQLFNGMTTEEILDVAILTSRSAIEIEPAYDHLTERLLLTKLDSQVFGELVPFSNRETYVRSSFIRQIAAGIDAGRIDPKLADFDLEKLAQALDPSRDLAFNYLGLQTLYDRYFLHIKDTRIETPQAFWMRVAMGVALNEIDKEDKAIAFYHLISTFRYIPGTPTLFNSGTCRPQLSSCYLLTVEDDLDSIFKMISDDARLSKWAGGLGNDWTNVRATNAQIVGTNGTSQGVIPFLKIANDTAVAVNQGGKRRGAMCAYLEVWHLDFEDFLDLRKNTGDERRRAHDMNTASWIPDLFMKRVQEGGEWTLFNPSDVPDLHSLFGRNFEQRYAYYEKEVQNGGIKLFKRLPAVELWRKMLSRLFETGHPWITWKDPSNIRSTQQHCGVVHSSNLCTEILLNTSQQETAVCNLGSINLKAHIKDGKLDEQKLKETTEVAIRMLDNVIDINFYPTPEAKKANSRHRPVGLGMMGFQDVLHLLDIPYASEEAVAFSDRSMEVISYYAILASANLAKERGAYSSYQGSLWSQGVFPIDTLSVLERERELPLEIDRDSIMDWTPVREHVSRYGMRNSQVMAIAPTATISQIIGVTQSIEPLYSVLYSKSNLSGDFIYVNSLLVQELKALGLWDRGMLDEFKYEDGSIQGIEQIPLNIREKYKTAFEVGVEWLIRCAAKRQKWIDMGQSLNLYLADPSGKKLDEMYQLAWRCGLKTTYYLRTRAATQVEKSTLDINRFGIQPKWMKNKSASSSIELSRSSCSLEDPTCESCQ